MELKKNPKKDLQRKYNLHLSVGFLVALALVVTAFEWKTAYEKPITLEEITGPFEPVDIAPQTVIPEPPKPKIVMPEEIIEVDDDDEVPEVDLVLDMDDALDIDDIIDDDPLPIEIAPEYVDYTDEMPTPAGGQDAFMAFLAKNIKYPKSGQRMGLQGRVFVQFIVDEQGNLTDIKVIKGINADFDNEAVRVLSQSPQWKPGKQRGRPVKVRMVIPIIYKLN